MSSKPWRTGCPLASLTGVIGLICLTLPALGGEKIIFTAPSKALALPMVEHTEKDDSRQELAISPASPFTGVDPGFAISGPETVILPSRSRSSRSSDRDFDPGSDRNSRRDSVYGADRQRDTDRNSGNPDRDDPRSSETDPERRAYLGLTGNKDRMNDDSSAEQWDSTQHRFVSVTNRWDMRKSWNSYSSNDPNKARSFGREDDRSLKATELGAWHSRDASDQKQEEKTPWNKGRAGASGGSFLSRALGSTHYWDKNSGESDKSKAGNSGIFKWSADATTSSEPTLFGSPAWNQRDTATGFGATDFSLPTASYFSAPKPEDQNGGLFKDTGGFQLPGMGATAFSDPVSKQDYSAPAPFVAPMPPAVLPMPKAPGSLFR